MGQFSPRILGTGHTVPGTIRHNDDPIFDWLKEHGSEGGKLFTGYEKRHVLADGEGLIDIMVPAAKLALDRAGIDAAQVDLLLGDGSISDYATPNTLSQLHQKLGLPSRALPLPVGNNFSQFNASMMMADALIRAGRANYVLVALGDNWTRYVSYRTPQSVSAADAAAACVVGPSDNGARWRFVDALTIADTSYYGAMFMDANVSRATSPEIDPASGLPYDRTHDFFQITEKGIKGFTDFSETLYII